MGDKLPVRTKIDQRNLLKILEVNSSPNATLEIKWSFSTQLAHLRLLILSSSVQLLTELELRETCGLLSMLALQSVQDSGQASLLQKSQQFLNKPQQRRSSIITARRSKYFQSLQKAVWCNWKYLQFFPSFVEVEKVHILHSNHGKLLLF